MESLFKKGEWVQITNHSLNGYVGYIIEHDFWDSKYRVSLTTNPIGRRAGGKVWIDEERLTSIDNVRHEEDLHSLIDFALYDNDKSYFHELTSLRRYPANENC